MFEKTRACARVCSLVLGNLQISPFTTKIDYFQDSRKLKPPLFNYRDILLCDKMFPVEREKLKLILRYQHERDIFYVINARASFIVYI